MPRARVAVALAAACILSSACAPRLADGADADDERSRAVAAAILIERDWPIAGSGPIVDLVRAVGDRLADAAGPVSFRWRFTVIRDRSLNAFAIGDGRIYVNEGAATHALTEAELAAILAHEMGHQLAGHFAESLRRRRQGFFSSLFGSADRAADDQSVGGLVRQFDLGKELDADRISLRLLSEARYDPQAALSIALRADDEPTGGYRHFGNERRIAALRALVERAPSGGRPDSEEFRRVKRSATDSR